MIATPGPHADRRRSSGSGIVLWLLVAVVALIVYGSLYPFNFKSDAVDGGLLAASRALSWARAGRGDRVANVLLYVPLGFCTFLWLEARLSRVNAGLLTVLIGVVLSLAIELAQVYVSARVPSLMDLTLNTAGAVAGAVAGAAWRPLGGFVYLPDSIRSSGVAAAAVVVTWIAWRLAPFTPRLDLARLKAALAPLARPDVNLPLLAQFLLTWLVVAQAVFALAGRRRGLDALLTLIATVLVARLVIDDQKFVPAELLALLLLLPALVLINGLRPLPRNLLLACGLVLALVGLELGPYALASSPQRFDLWPFLTWRETGFPIDLATILARTFFYAAIVFLLREAGFGALGGIAALFAVVIAIELADVWQLDGAPSITRPAIAALLAFVVYGVERRSRRG